MTIAATDAWTITPEDAMSLESGDYGGPMRDVFELMDEGDLITIEAIAESLRKNGWVGPPIKVVEGVLLDGHHRAIAAHRVGIAAIPHSEEGGYSWQPQWRNITSSRL